MAHIIKALINTVFMALIIGLFLGCLIAAALFTTDVNPLVWYVSEGFAAFVTLAISAIIFVHAYNYERYGDAHRPLNAETVPEA